MGKVFWLLLPATRWVFFSVYARFCTCAYLLFICVFIYSCNHFHVFYLNWYKILLNIVLLFYQHPSRLLWPCVWPLMWEWSAVSLKVLCRLTEWRKATRFIYRIPLSCFIGWLYGSRQSSSYFVFGPNAFRCLSSDSFLKREIQLPECITWLVVPVYLVPYDHTKVCSSHLVSRITSCS